MLTLEHVSKSYGGLPVLNDLSLTLSEGEILALIGPSGCGKSTLLNIISGLVRPDAGSVSGADVKMSYMFQSARLLPWRTVRENIRIVREDAAEEEVAAIIGEVLTTSSGIGGAITTARLNIEPDAIIAWSILLVLGCFATQKLLRVLFCRKETRPC